MGWEHVIPQFVTRMRDLCRNGNDPVPFPIQGTGFETRAFVHIEDFTEGLMLLLERGQHLGIYNIGTSEEITISSVAQEIGRYFGKNVTILPGKLSQGSTLRRCPDISKMTALGYCPKVPFREGLPLVARWYDENAEVRPAK